MFDDHFFEQWLDDQAQAARNKITKQETLSQNDMLVLVLKAQTNHINHSSKKLHEGIVTLRKDMDIRLEQVDKHFKQVDQRIEQVDRRLEQVDQHLEQVDQHLEQVDQRLEQVDQHLEQVDRRLEQVDQHLKQIDKRFEQSDRRFEQMQQQSQQQFQLTIARTDSLMKCSIGTTLIVGGLVITAMRFIA